MQSQLKQIEEILNKTSLPLYDDLFNLTNSVSTILENEKTEYRPQAKSGEAGSLLNFLQDDLPLVIVPDIHARPFFIGKILNYTLPEDFIPLARKEYTVFEALKHKKIRLICLGDALHTEYQTKERWQAAMAEFSIGLYTGPFMSEEMLLGMNTICALMKLKEFFPANFHFLKGNHENIMNKNTGGDFSFLKFAQEGAMVREFIHDYYGDDILYLLSCVENAMPLAVITKWVALSHAEPEDSYSLEEIINARAYPSVISGFTWTANDTAKETSCSEIIKNLNPQADIKDYAYIAGHRPVKGNYNLRQKGLFIQIHNPAKENVALVYNNRKFNPQSDIVNVSNEVIYE